MLNKMTLGLIIAAFTIGCLLPPAIAHEHTMDSCRPLYESIKLDFDRTFFWKPKDFVGYYIRYFEQDQKCAHIKNARTKVCLDFLLKEHIDYLTSIRNEEETEEFLEQLRTFQRKTNEEFKKRYKGQTFIANATRYLQEKGLDAAFRAAARRLKPLNRIKANKVFEQLKESKERATRRNEC